MHAELLRSLRWVCCCSARNLCPRTPFPMRFRSELSKRGACVQPEGQERAAAATLWRAVATRGLQQGSCDRQMLAAFSTTSTPCPSATCCPPGRTRSPPGPSQAVASPTRPSWNPLSGACFLKTAFMLQIRRHSPSEPLVVASMEEALPVSPAHQLFIVFTAFPTFLVQMCLCLGKQKLHKRRGCICRVHSCAPKASGS